MKYKTRATFSGVRADNGQEVSEPIEIVISTATKASARDAKTFEALAWKSLRELRPDWVPADHADGPLFLPAQGLWKIRPVVTLSGQYEKISMTRAAKRALEDEREIMDAIEAAKRDADAVIARAREMMAARDAGAPEPGPLRNTSLTICYRDGGNNKENTDVVISGLITEEHIAAIRSHLDDGEYFIANQVGLPTPSEKFAKKYDFPLEDSDHVFSTLFYDGCTADEMHTHAEPTLEMSVEDLVEMFRNVKSWDEAAEWHRLQDVGASAKRTRTPAP